MAIKNLLRVYTSSDVHIVAFGNVSGQLCVAYGIATQRKITNETYLKLFLLDIS